MDWLKQCLVLIIVIILLAIYFRNYIRLVILVFSLKGPEVTPIFGNILKMRDSKWMIRTANNVHNYGLLMRAWVFFVPVIFVYELEHLKIILGCGRNSKKNLFYSALHNFLGQGLITNDGYKWKKNRRLIQPYFQMHVLENYIKIFSQCSEDLVKNMKGKNEVKITTLINNCVLDLLHKAILGIPLEGQSTPFREGEVFLIERLVKPWLLLESIFKFSKLAEDEKLQKLNLQNYTKWVLKQRKLGIKSTETISLLDVFIELSESYSDFTEEDIINEACTFMLAGQDSVASALAYTLFYLAKYQDIQKKVVAELEDIFIGDITSITVKELNSMVYLEQCIKETLRLIPSVPILARVLKEDVKLGDHVIPSGTNIMISPFITHRLPHVFPDPLTYNPERFSPENCSKMHPYAFIPFSMGPRNCIGAKFAMMEMKTIICAILRGYSISLSPKNEQLELKYRVTIRAKGGVWLCIKPRS